MVLLLAKLGGTFPIRLVRERLRCGECRSKDFGIRIVWDNSPALDRELAKNGTHG